MQLCLLESVASFIIFPQGSGRVRLCSSQVLIFLRTEFWEFWLTKPKTEGSIREAALHCGFWVVGPGVCVCNGELGRERNVQRQHLGCVGRSLGIWAGWFCALVISVRAADVLIPMYLDAVRSCPSSFHITRDPALHDPVWEWCVAGLHRCACQCTHSFLSWVTYMILRENLHLLLKYFLWSMCNRHTLPSLTARIQPWQWLLQCANSELCGCGRSLIRAGKMISSWGPETSHDRETLLVN